MSAKDEATCDDHDRKDPREPTQKDESLLINLLDA